MQRIHIDPNSETPVRAINAPGFNYRYAYARAAESRQADESGQDYLLIAPDQRSFVFALCDGVGQSFFGDLAAKFLAGALVDWLQDEPTSESGAFCTGLAAHLRRLTGPATELVQELALPADLAPLLRQVLEEKRTHGSESTFVCGRVDLSSKHLPKGSIKLAWMGDTRLRLWGGEGEITMLPADSFRTNQRWSTRRGPVNGEPHCYVGPLAGIVRLASYSDGLAVLDRGDVSESDQSLNEIIAAEQRAPESDDIAYLELVLREPVTTAEGPAALPAPRQVWLALREGRLQAAWPPVAGATSYQILLTGGPEPQTYQTSQPSWQGSATLDAGEYRIQVRALRGSQVGAWSLPATAVAPEPEPVIAASAATEAAGGRPPVVRAAIILFVGLMVVLMCSAAFLFLPGLLSDWLSASRATPTLAMTETALAPATFQLTATLQTTPTLAPTVTPAPATDTATATNSPSPSATQTWTPTSSATVTASPTLSPTVSPLTPTVTITATIALTIPVTATSTPTPLAPSVAGALQSAAPQAVGPPALIFGAGALTKARHER